MKSSGGLPPELEDTSSLHETLLPTALVRVFPRDPLFWFMMAAFALVSYVFYSTEFRDTLEDWFFDVRMKWAPEVAPVNDLVVVSIDDQAIEVLDSDRFRTRYDVRKRPFLSIESLTSVASILTNSDATAVVLLAPNHSFLHSDPEMKELTEIVRYDPRMFIGTTEYNRQVPGVTQIPLPLGSISDRVFGYETFRKRSNVVVRTLPYLSFRGLNEDLMLPTKLAMTLGGTFGDLSGSYTINQIRPSRFETISAAEARLNPRELQKSVRNKVVVVGYTVPRDVPFQTTDMMLVNTPLVGDVQSADQGESLTYLTANAIENLLHNRDLTPADTVVNFAQTIMVAVICGLMWEFGSLAASVITAALWIILIYIHSLIFSWFNIAVPLADTFLASALISIFAAVNKLKTELKEIAERQTNAESKTEIARLQSHFLDEFSGWLKVMTELVITKIQASKPGVLTTAPDSGALFHRAFAAGEDFHEYLESIRQIPSLENAAVGRLHREKIILEPFIERITRRFAVKLGDRGMRIHISIAKDAQTLRVNASLLDSIIFNYISNAVKYSPKNSTITIRVRKTTRRRTIISVMDEGVGIAPALRERVFEKFYRIQDDRLYGAKGTGLGLYLCRYFAEQMGGRVDVRTGDHGIGSEFRVVLP